MIKKISIKENILNVLAIATITIILTTIIGYFDEGHQNIYNGFWNYLQQGGYPPINDYLVWTIFFCIAGIISFNIFSLGFKQKLFRYRFVLSFLFLPFFFMFSLVLIGIILSF